MVSVQRGLCVAVLLAGLAPAAHGQTVASFERLPMRLNLGDTVTVRGDAGARWRGRIVAMTPDHLVLRIRETDVTVTSDRVRSVAACCDRLWDGALIGFGIAGVLGALTVGGFADAPDRASDVALGVAWFGGVGAAVGFGIDALLGREVAVYRAPDVGLQVASDVGGRRLLLVVRW